MAQFHYQTVPMARGRYSRRRWANTEQRRAHRALAPYPALEAAGVNLLNPHTDAHPIRFLDDLPTLAA